MSWRTIGILGGSGVAAAAALVQRIVDLVTDTGARFDQDHPELILIQATQVPSRSLWLEGKGPSFVPGYVDAARRLRGAGAAFVAICCNTAHAAHQEIAREAGVPVIDLIDVSARAALGRIGSTSTIGVLSSDGTRLAGLYGRAFAALAPDVRVIEPDDQEQKEITRGIIGVKRGWHRNPSGEAALSALFADAAERLVARGAQAIILGCTEIPLAFPADFAGAPVIDTIDELARACLHASAAPGA